jgi:2-haloacid dehalogenase
MGKYQNFWTVSEQALEFTTRRLGVEVSPGQRPRLMNAWLEPRPYSEVPAVLARLKERYPLAILSNGSPKMLQAGLVHSGLKADFRWVISADAVKLYKPSPKVYAQAPKQMKLKKADILFVSSNSFDVLGAKSFGFRVCWITRAGVPLDALGPRPDLVVASFEALRTAMD